MIFKDLVEFQLEPTHISFSLHRIHCNLSVRIFLVKEFSVFFTARVFSKQKQKLTQLNLFSILT